MKILQKPRYKKIMMAAVAGCIIFGTWGEFKTRKPLESVQMQENVQTAGKKEAVKTAASLILECRVFSELEDRFPAFSAHFEKIAKDGKALSDLYDMISEHMIKLMDDTRRQEEVGYKDDLSYIYYLADLADGKKPTKTKMAMIFLSLPRLYQRAIVLPWDEGGIEASKLRAETSFLQVLEQEGFAKLKDAIKVHWYKEDKWPPIKEERDRFFKAFSELYQP